ncbi:MAG: carbamoyltransferase HypF [Saprospiraceae bacterium]
MKAKKIHITGQVQGVGFRPFIYRLAKQYRLTGWVNNGTDGVFIHIEGPAESVDRFEAYLRLKPPALSIITKYESQATPVQGNQGFRIIESEAPGPGTVLLTPDLALCATCREEMFHPDNRRYHYAFTTCTQCGPRYSIIRSLPYDRPLTTMSHFPMCKVCQEEYNDPLNSRHHAQTNSCPDCPVNLSWYNARGHLLHHNQTTAVASAVQAIISGFIVAVKGIGGYLLMADATNPKAVELLRERKHRPAKPFAVLYGDRELLEQDVHLDELSWQQLVSPASPIVLLPFKDEEPLSGIQRLQIAPGLTQLGVMWTYSPLLELISKEAARPLIATSGNRSGSPIYFQDEEARSGLESIADFFLVNDRPIVVPQDDSVLRLSPVYKQRIVLRRSRGMAPSLVPSLLPDSDECLLAMGASLKSTFAFTFHQNTYISQYLGDSDHYQVQVAYQQTLDHLLHTTGAQPTVLLVDRHPEYSCTRLGKQRATDGNLPVFEIQHHQAHFLAVMAEHELVTSDQPVLGFIWDGTGLGEDGQIWGGEVIRYERGVLTRINHLQYVAHLAGDRMARDTRLPAMAFSQKNPDVYAQLQQQFDPTAWKVYHQMLESTLALWTSSIGRLFDAAACLLGLAELQSFEGEAAMLLEAQAWKGVENDGWDMDPYAVSPWDGNELILALFHDKSPVPNRAARFHRTLIDWMYVETVAQVGIRQIVCSGGVWQNAMLVDMALHFRPDGYKLYFQEKLSPNDESISFGQLAYYHYVIRKNQIWPDDQIPSKN